MKQMMLVLLCMTVCSMAIIGCNSSAKRDTNLTVNKTTSQPRTTQGVSTNSQAQTTMQSTRSATATTKAINITKSYNVNYIINNNAISINKIELFQNNEFININVAIKNNTNEYVMLKGVTVILYNSEGVKICVIKTSGSNLIPNFQSHCLGSGVIDISGFSNIEVVNIEASIDA